MFVLDSICSRFLKIRSFFIDFCDIPTGQDLLWFTFYNYFYYKNTVFKSESNYEGKKQIEEDCKTVAINSLKILVS